jgi:serine/threonine-protein kinase
MKGPHEAGDIVAGRYEVKKFVGEGGMQFVYGAHDNILHRDIALKTPKVDSAEKRFRRSAVVSAKVNHPNVAKTLDYFEEDNTAYLVEELIDGLDLEKAILSKSKFLDPFLVAKILHHLAKGLAASHHAGVVHRDLKPTNIMVTGDFQLTSIKITDFGIAKMAADEISDAAEGGGDTISTSKTAVGALPYMAPEAITTPKEVTLKADVWSLGAMMYEVLTGNKPFGSGLKAVHSIIEAKTPKYPEYITSKAQFKELSIRLIDVINSCLQKSPDNRPTADELVNMCGNFCYPISKREFGVIDSYHHNSWGFISKGYKPNVFFHKNSVYGELPSVGDRVMFSEFDGGGSNRAYPVICLD